jgi:ankyrin repeat protein
VAVLLSKGADLEADDDRGRTPLHYAAEAGHAQIVSLLLSKGAQAAQADANEDTP